jgi:hypothetical protein
MASREVARCSARPAKYDSAMHASVIRPAVIAFCLALVPLNAHADSEFKTPAPGSRERRAIMAAVRPKVEAAYQLKVKFSVRALESNGAIALVFVEPLDKAGRVIGSLTRKDDRGETLELDGWVFAIAKKQGKTWTIVEIDMLQSIDGLEIWPSAYPEIPREVFELVGVATERLS